MSYWTRWSAVRKADPYHDAEGRFASADGASAGSVAQKLYASAVKSEPQISDDIQRALPDGAKLEGFNYRLKSPGSIEEKLGKIVADGTAKNPEEAVREMRDLVRYTATVPADKYVSGMQTMLGKLQGEGYKVSSFRNYWGGSVYQGVNTNLISPSGQVLELQFHTPQSFEAKQANHADYEIARKPDVSESDAEAAKDRMVERQKQLEVPKGILGYQHG